MVTFLFVFFLVVTILNILYYIGFFGFATANPNPYSKSSLPVSVIICAKNEAENLQQFLPSIIDQDYPNFEIILVNDASTDETLEVMENFISLNPQIKLVNVQNNEAFWGKKKYALTLGIKKAKNPYLLFTDADCAPVSNSWIEKMMAGFEKEKSIVLGYGGYFREKMSFINSVIRFETLLTAIQYFSYAKVGIPYMGVGRNLAYTSAEFFEQNGFATHLHIRSGDDDLFVNQAATSANTAISFERDSITRSIPKKTYKDWYDQKRRHTSTASLYKNQHKLLLGSFYLTQLFFWLTFPVLLILQVFWPAVAILVAVRFIFQFIVFWNSASKFDETDLLWMFPVLELFLICSQLGIFISNIFSKSTNWK